MPIKAERRKKTLPIDRLAIIVIVFLSLLIALLIWGGKLCGSNCFLHQGPQINYFSWRNRLVGQEDIAFILGFDRPMNRESVTANLNITPPLSGKVSWSGKRLAYTLTEPIPYGEDYTIELSQAKALNGDLIQPWKAQVKSRDRAFAYIATSEADKGRLILYNWTTQQQHFLTPENLLVTDFQFSASRDFIVLAAVEKTQPDNLRHLKLYRVATGLNQSSLDSQLELILDDQDYQNNQFDFSADGQKVVVQRVNRSQPTDFDLWLLEIGKKPRPLGLQGGDFLIAPDSKTLAVAQGEGISLISLEENAEVSSFLPQFGRLLTFSPDGSAAALVNFNTDNPELRFTRSLFYVNNFGTTKELLNTTGSILGCQFNPHATYLYCLLTELITGESYLETPYFAAINLENNQFIPLLKLPSYQDIHLSMSPDGLGILFDQVITSNQEQSLSDMFKSITDSESVEPLLRTESGAEIIGGNLWLLITPPSNLVDSTDVSLEELPFSGWTPKWAP